MPSQFGLQLVDVNQAPRGSAKAPTIQNSLVLRDRNSGFWLIIALAPAQDVYIQAANQRLRWLRTAETSLQKFSLACFLLTPYLKVFDPPPQTKNLVWNFFDLNKDFGLRKKIGLKRKFWLERKFWSEIFFV